MTAERNRRSLCTTLFLAAILFGAPPVLAQYSGGSGTADDPYQIATAADLITLGETPDDYDKHFILTADIDLSPGLPGGRVFDKAIIAPDVNGAKQSYQGPVFSGTLDGRGYRIANMTISGEGYVGLFGILGEDAHVLSLSLENATIVGTADYVGSLAALNRGLVSNCHSDGSTAGTQSFVGGLIGFNEGFVGRCDSAGTVSGNGGVGGLAGDNYCGAISDSYSTSTVRGSLAVGGLTGDNQGGTISGCFSTGTVAGNTGVGGLAGRHLWCFSAKQCLMSPIMVNCWSSASVSGQTSVGGLAGIAAGAATNCYSTGPVAGETRVGGFIGYITNISAAQIVGFWDMETSGQSTSAAGTGLITAQMQDPNTYREAGWDFAGRWEDGASEAWQMPETGGYPVLAVFNGYTPPQLQGRGTLEDPYVLHDALDLGAMYHHDHRARYRLARSIDLSDVRWSSSVISTFGGAFDGSSHSISNLTIKGTTYLGLFGRLEDGAEVRDLGVVDANIAGSSDSVGGLAGQSGGDVTDCYVSGAVRGILRVGGLIGDSGPGVVTRCRSEVFVTGEMYVGGLTGFNWGTIVNSLNQGAIAGSSSIGGLVGSNGREAVVSNSYSTGSVTGRDAGGLVGDNSSGIVLNCYSTGPVTGNGDYVGGLLALNYAHSAVLNSFWDISSSKQTTSAGGTGLETAQMQTAQTFLDAGWDFVGETDNGVDDIWWIDEGQDYPRLWWELEEHDAAEDDLSGRP